MSYNNRIQLIEKEILRLEDEMKILSSRYSENSDTATTIVNGIVKDMNSLTQEFKDKKSKDQLKELRMKVFTVVEKMKIAFELMKKTSHLKLGELRLKSNIIRKISPDTADIIDIKINELEKIDLGLLKSWQTWSEVPGEKNHKIKQKEREDFADNYSIKFEEIISVITLSRNCIKDTIDRIKQSD